MSADDLKGYYQRNIENSVVQLKRLQKKRNGFTWLKVILILTICYLLYLLSVDSDYSCLYGAMVGVLLFIFINVLESKLLKKIAFEMELKKCFETERNYLNGEYTNLSPGDAFKDAEHPYALDLDLFGEGSLYQSLNRTVTRGGGEILRHWLLTPCKEREVIEERQRAVRELREASGWCHTFRAIGKQYNLEKILQGHKSVHG